ncbi:MAG: sulfatase-like hydrolase/transferase [Lentisphaerae bacterium]|jgi:arylsulfatase|nr:sulfatase-like hydrolase/transferase [Lentisphaerota bacterium]MBT4822623.1 sulfatase-like hydrolase/transferase [Lentisphaerota bacterium]MBT5607933.1 sulfatase-like hydrolase/transferase [Lentisphaerota bacterium]MBT7056547.1 sulfatase-like hydrolase/transferase [Lentisphaerota bacterium]MBT7846338.1 sulfatase-like hydrolase/transferase [Lentisphaerota bacterium]
MNSPLNILFLMTDQQRADHVGFLPGSTFETPNIDRIADSVAFADCATVNPICTPARTALLTGKYTHQIGTLSMSGDLSPQHPTYMRAMQEIGYFTAGIGKFHWLQGWPWQADRGKGHDLVALKEKMKGFGLDYVWETAGKQLAQRNYCEQMAVLDQKGLLEAYRDHTYARGRNFNEASKVEFTGEPWPFDDEDYVDILTGDRIVECIRERPQDKPFCIFGSFCGPHAPFDPPQSYLDQIPYEEVDDFVVGDAELPPETKELMWTLRRSYRAMLRVIDDQVGRIFETLEQEGLLDNTVVFFTTDHGEMMGDHGRFQKSTWHHQASTVPTAVRHPHHLNRRLNASPVEITDITATILDIAGLNPVAALSKPWPAFNNIVPCRSLMPIVRGETDRIREFAFSECSGQWQMIQTEEWKYVRFLQTGSPGAPDERLFNKKTDPDELMDRAGDQTCVNALQWCRDQREHLVDTTPPAQLKWAPVIP